MGNLTIATTFIVIINVLMWFSTLGMLAANPDGTMCYNLEGSIIEQVTLENGTIVNPDVMSDLPETSGSISTYSDPFGVIGTWLKSIPGVRYIYSVITAPYNILKCMGMPNEFVVGVGTIWYIITLLVVVGWWMGRD